MQKLITRIMAGAALLMAASPAVAQDNILAEKPIFTLGEALTWTAGDESYTFKTEDLPKLVAVPTNTSNVFLYPENGTLNTAENQAKGAQVFYIDMGSVMSVGIVSTTWEGAAANDYNIYLTDVEPTPAVLATTPTYTVENLGQYTAHTAVMPEGAKGRYLVFQVTRATNWGWGVKIRSISAAEPSDDVLTTFRVSPSIIASGVETPVTLTLLNQNGIAIAEEDVEVSVSDNAVFENGNLTILSGNSATFTATLGETLTTTVYTAQAPAVPAATSIKTPIYTNTVTDYNGTAEFTVAYNGGAINAGEIEFADGEVARLFEGTRCVFFSNSVTTGAWNGNINPSAEGYRNLCLDVFSGGDVDCTIEFESVENLDGGHTFPFTLKAGEWNPISVNVAGATKLGNLSIRFSEANMADILLANIYFTPAYVEGDEEAPVITIAEATPAMTSVDFKLAATDDLSEDVYFSISDGTKTYAATGKSGETVEFTVTGLTPSTTYNFAITASDGKNVSATKELQVSTTGMPDADKPSIPESNVLPIYSTGYGTTELPVFDAWGSSASMGVIATENGNEVLLFSNYNGQWGGLVNLDMDVEGAKNLCISVYSDFTGSFMLAPVWAGANGENTPGYKIEVSETNKWANFAIDLATFGYDTYGTTVIQLALTESTLPSFAVDNLYFSGDQELAVNEIIAGENTDIVNVYTPQGICVKKGVNISDATTSLPAGLYIIGGKKVVVK